jgi:hypothetical protein
MNSFKRCSVRSVLAVLHFKALYISLFEGLEGFRRIQENTNP